MLLFIFATIGVELFGRLDCSDEIPCQGLDQHSNFKAFDAALLTLFRVATNDNWNGILLDTLRDECNDSKDCVQNCCANPIVSIMFFVIFKLLVLCVTVNAIIAMLLNQFREYLRDTHDNSVVQMQTNLREFNRR